MDTKWLLVGGHFAGDVSEISKFSGIFHRLGFGLAFVQVTVYDICIYIHTVPDHYK